MTKINFSEYAKQYDIMAKNNPAYVEIENKVISIFSNLIDNDNYIIGDFGAGTGNFSFLLKKKFPSLKIVSLERDSEFILKFREKIKENDFDRLLLVQGDLLNSCIRERALDAILMVHVLNLLPDQERAIQTIYDALKVNGHLVIFDVGRPLNVLDWGVYMVKNSLRRNGLLKTIQLLRNSNLVAKQNRIFSKGQKTGLYELNTLAEFKKKFDRYPFEFVEESDKYYRCIDNYLLLRKII